MKILFPHIPKCAGSSIKSQISNHPKVVMDYTNHPTWQSEHERNFGRESQMKLISELYGKDDWIVFGHFGVYQYSLIDWDLAIILLRNPVKRLLSLYRYFKQKIDFPPAAISRHPELKNVLNGTMSVNDFALLDHVRFFYSKYYLRNIKKFRNRVIFLDLDDYTQACRIISGVLNWPIDPSVRISITKEETQIFDINIIKEDCELYSELTF